MTIFILYVVSVVFSFLSMGLLMHRMYLLNKEKNAWSATRSPISKTVAAGVYVAVLGLLPIVNIFIGLTCLSSVFSGGVEKFVNSYIEEEKNEE